ncbi:DUF6166 domain-containing protein [Candidatus Methylacidiphilum infernorum]|uniref:DUF6166 domain-containing protein n=1 Tax=Candidatus Methylacidiphilum infernorum TaxID=511746 RepID=UPI000662C389|nr:DUF6166 domain-containing protein [Candidatus Methylacidiphilum infernorum]
MKEVKKNDDKNKTKDTVYKGKTAKNGKPVVTVTENGKTKFFPMYNNEFDLPPGGSFAWRYGGTAPWRLSYSILRHHTDEKQEKYGKLCLGFL